MTCGLSHEPLIFAGLLGLGKEANRRVAPEISVKPGMLMTAVRSRWWRLGPILAAASEKEPVNLAEDQRRYIPISSLLGPSNARTDSLRVELYLTELDRQATMVNDGIVAAWQRAMMRGTSGQDSRVWADLQGALFAAIVVARLLRPLTVKKVYPGHASRGESQRYAKDRGDRLCKLLEVPDDAYFFRVAAVRNAFEHIDERLDSVIASGAASVSDWYISDGLASRTSGADKPDGPVGYGLRVFFPAAGTLYFDDEILDLYRLDAAMLDLRDAIPKALERLHEAVGVGAGYNCFSGRLVPLLSEAQVDGRLKAWMKHRVERGHPVNVRVHSLLSATQAEPFRSPA